MLDAKLMYWERLSKFSETPNYDAETFGIDIDYPRLVRPYYDICADIGIYNHHRQDEMELECIFKTHYWSYWVNLLIYGMFMVDADNLYLACNDQRFVYSKYELLYSNTTH